MSVQALKNLALKEIRVHLCPRSSSSNGTRQFIEKYYLSIKQKNPNLPILIRECTGVEPKMWFRYEYGKETNASLDKLNADQIVKLLDGKVAM